MLQVCNEVDSSSFVTHDRDPSCHQDPCSVVRTTCVVKEMIEWLGRNCSDPDTLSAEGDDCISAASVDLLASYGLERVPDVSCFSMSVAEEDRCLLPQDKANRTPHNDPGTLQCSLSAVAAGILFDFYEEVSKFQHHYVGLIGFTDYSDRDARVLYMTIRFPVQLKEGSFYTVPELSIPFDAIDGYVNSLTVPASAGGVLPTHRTTSRYWIFMHTQSICETVHRHHLLICDHLLISMWTDVSQTSPTLSLEFYAPSRSRTPCWWLRRTTSSSPPPQCSRSSPSSPASSASWSWWAGSSA